MLLDFLAPISRRRILLPLDLAPLDFTTFDLTLSYPATPDLALSNLVALDLAPPDLHLSPETVSFEELLGQCNNVY